MATYMNRYRVDFLKTSYIAIVANYADDLPPNLPCKSPV